MRPGWTLVSNSQAPLSYHHWHGLIVQLCQALDRGLVLNIAETRKAMRAKGGIEFLQSRGAISDLEWEPEDLAVANEELAELGRMKVKTQTMVTGVTRNGVALALAFCHEAEGNKRDDLVRQVKREVRRRYTQGVPS